MPLVLTGMSIKRKHSMISKKSKYAEVDSDEDKDNEDDSDNECQYLTYIFFFTIIVRILFYHAAMQ